MTFDGHVLHQNRLRRRKNNCIVIVYYPNPRQEAGRSQICAPNVQEWQKFISYCDTDSLSFRGKRFIAHESVTQETEILWREES